MKLIIFIFTAVATLMAEEPPAYMRDGNITVTLKSGKQYEYSTNEWMVVRRGSKKVQVAGTRELVEESQVVAGPNKLRLMGGYGPNGLQAEQRGSTLHVESKYGLVGGLGYARQLSRRLSLGASIYTNGTTSLDLGVDF